MKPNPTITGIFVLLSLTLFTAGLYLIGNRHKAFTHHIDFYTELHDVNGIQAGSKVRVSGYDAGQVTGLTIPSQPTGKFRIKLHLDDKLRNLIRTDSVVIVETDGLVGNKYLQIQPGSDQVAQASADATLRSQEPIEFSAVIAKATGIMDQANATIGDLRSRLDGTVDAIHTTVSNTNGMITNANGMVSDVRHGKGTVGMLLNDPETAGRIKTAVANTQEASANLNKVTQQVGQVVTDLQQRNLGQKAEDTLSNARDTTQQLDQTAHTVNTTLDEALGPDRAGATAGVNLRDTLSNVNLATANMAEDTEALKHNFFFRGFFKKRGYYNLGELTPDQYRENRFFQNSSNQRGWLNASDAFSKDEKGNEILSEAGAMQIDSFIGAHKDAVIDQPIVVEGYSDQASAADQMTLSRSRSLLVSRYLEKRFHLSPRNVGIMPLNESAPHSSGKDSWNGVCIVLIAQSKAKTK